MISVFLPGSGALYSHRTDTQASKGNPSGEYDVPGRGSSHVSHSAASAELEMHKLLFASSELD